MSDVNTLKTLLDTYSTKGDPYFAPPSQASARMLAKKACVSASLTLNWLAGGGPSRKKAPLLMKP